jgi:hypothetical protein
MSYEFLGALYHTAYGTYFGPRKDMTNPLPLEFAFWALVLLLTALLMLRRRTFAGLERRLTQLSRRRWLTVAAVFLAVVALRGALFPLVGVPVPDVHDEFSYLFQADTFVAGRLTNPAHPMWVHFESFHLNVLPTYQSMYPPGQGLFLAAAQWLTGTPWLGVWLSAALMCAAVTWMLQAWMPPPWPLVGGLFCVLRFALFSYWINSYWGGAVAAFAGALVLGAAGRLRRRLSMGHALVLAAGLVLLANSRPYEGLLLSVPVLVALLVWVRRRPLRAIGRRLALPVATILILGAAAMLYYNWRGTGHPLLMPYQVNQRAYHITNTFLWQPRNPMPAYNHEVFRRFYTYWELPDYIRLHRDPDGLQFVLEKKLRAYYSFYVWPAFLLLLPACWQMLKSARMRVFPCILLVVLAGSMLIIWEPQGHYLAPAEGPLVGAMLYGLRMLRAWRPRRLPVGVTASRALAVAMLGWILVLTAREVLNPFHLGTETAHLPHYIERARLEAQLERLPGLQLILVKCHRTHQAGEDWVYNRADVDQAKVVWARDMGPERNRELLEYYRDRHAWIVDQDDGIRRLTDYASSPDLAAASLPLRLLHFSDPGDPKSTTAAATANAPATRK